MEHIRQAFTNLIHSLKSPLVSREEGEEREDSQGKKGKMSKYRHRERERDIPYMLAECIEMRT